MRRNTLRALVKGLSERPPEKVERGWYRISDIAVSEGADAARIDIYEPIGYWDYSAAEFVMSVSRLTVDRIEVHLNSPGGDCFDGIAIKNVLAQHPAHVTVVVDALAASIATVIAMGADEVIMAPGSMMMIHDAWTYDAGNAADLRKQADLLDQISDNIADVYAAKAGGTSEGWRSLMLVETWFNADEAVAAGLADRVGEGAVPSPGNADEGDPLLARHDLGIFAYAGRDKAPAPPIPAPRDEVDPVVEPSEQTSEDSIVEPADEEPSDVVEVIDFAALWEQAREAVK